MPRQEGKKRMLTPVSIVLVLALFQWFWATPFFVAAAPITIRLWDYHVHDKKFRLAIFKEFNKANPDIKVEYTSQIGAAYQTVLDAAIRSGDMADIFQPIGAATQMPLMKMGKIIPLDDVAPNEEALHAWMARFPTELVPFLEGGNVIDGKVYTWPIGGEGGRMLLFWNMKLFREAGLKGSDGGPAVPETWDQLRSFAKKITELGQNKVYGITHGIKDGSAWGQDISWSIANAAGWRAVPWGFDLKMGHFDFHDPAFRGALQLWLDMKKDGSIFPGDLSMDDEMAKFKFAQDLAGMIFGGPWVPGGLLAVSDSLEFDVVLPPTPEKGKRKGYLYIGPLASMSEYLISKSAKSQDPMWKNAVWKVVTFMTSQTYQEAWVKAGGGFSVFPEYNKPEYFPHPTIGKIALMATTGRRIVPQISPDATTVLWDAIMAIDKPDYISAQTFKGIYIGQLPMNIWDDVERRSEISLDKAIVDANQRGIKLSRADYTFPDWDPTQNYPPPKGK